MNCLLSILNLCHRRVLNGDSCGRWFIFGPLSIMGIIKQAPAVVTLEKPSTLVEAFKEGGKDSGVGGRSISQGSLTSSIRSEDFSEVCYMTEFPYRKSVSFSSLQIRSYSVTVGDHPCCTAGLPLTLDWDYTEEVSEFTVDEYEEERSPHRRHRSDLIISAEQRQEILTETSTQELRKARRQLHRDRSSRSKLCERTNASFFADSA